MEKKYKIAALVGPAGSGKDYIMKQLLAAPGLSEYLHEIISCTTRPIRDGETPGRNYHFLTMQEFGDKVLNFEMLEATEFNGWFYGTPLSSLESNKINVGVFNPDGIRAMLDNPNIELRVFVLEVPDKIRLLRQLNREIEPDIEEIFRRWKADKESFDDLEFEYFPINNSEEDNGSFVLYHLTQQLHYWPTLIN